MNEQPLKVSELVSCIKTQLENEFSDVWIEGEISNLSQSATGHWYFNLSDQDSSLPCCLFKNMVYKNAVIHDVKDGQKISIKGKLSVYAKRTSVQVIANEIIILKDQGDLKAKFEKLKSSLAKEGLFDLDKKKKIPPYVKSIALITSEKGAVLQDIISVMKRRSIEYSIRVFPSIVQGEGAPISLIQSLDLAERMGNFDVIVLARGGGSQEDLWCFNDELLVRRIFKCKFPTVSAIGHETDFTLSDFVSDLRAETPTAAAEILSSSQLKLKEKFMMARKSLLSYGEKKIQFLNFQKSTISPKYQLGLIKEILFKKKSKISKLVPQSIFISKKIENKKIELDYSIDKISVVSSDILQKYNMQLEQVITKVNALSPLKVLERGYAIVSTKDGKVIARNKQMNKIQNEDSFLLRFFDGTLEVKKVKG